MRWLSCLLALGLLAACTTELSADAADSGASSGDEGSGDEGSGDENSASGGQTTGSGNAPSWADVSGLIQRSCATNDCHGGEEEPDMQDPASYAALLFETIVEECDNSPLVRPGEPETSALLMLVQRQCADDLFMPENCTRDPCVSASTIDTWSRWIAAGAPVQ